MASALPAGGLALSARGWPASPAGTSRGRPSGQEHLDEPRIKCAAGLALKLLHGRLDRQGHSIGTVGGQRVEDVGDRDDARADGNPVPTEPVGVPAPVPALVMMPNDLGSLREEVEGRDDRAPISGWPRLACRSSADSAPVFRTRTSGTPILPMS